MSAKQLNPAYDGMTDQQVKRFKYWEFRTMAMCIFGYALFYFVRKNLSIAMPYLNEEMGNSAAANADAMIYDAMAAFYMACASFMSQNYGAGKLDRMRKSYFISLAYSFGVGLLLGGGLLLFGRQFLALFTTESAVIDAGMKRIMVMGLAYCISAFMDCTIAASRGLGKTIGPTVIVILGSCVFRVIWVYTIFAHFHTIPSLYLLYPFSWLLTAAAEIVYFIFSYRQAIRIFHEREALAQL